jgi:hypothetical protein
MLKLCRSLLRRPQSLSDASWLRDRAQAPGADVDALSLPIDLDCRPLDVCLEHPVRLVVRVANLVTEAWPLATNLTFTGQSGPLYVTVFRQLRLRTGWRGRACACPQKRRIAQSIADIHLVVLARSVQVAQAKRPVPVVLFHISRLCSVRSSYEWGVLVRT